MKSGTIRIVLGGLWRRNPSMVPPTLLAFYAMNKAVFRAPPRSHGALHYLIRLNAIDPITIIPTAKPRRTPKSSKTGKVDMPSMTPLIPSTA